MAYTVFNYRTKKALIEDVKNGKKVKVFQPGIFGPTIPDGPIALEGPHYPEPHRWYASAIIEDRIIKSIR